MADLIVHPSVKLVRFAYIFAALFAIAVAGYAAMAHLPGMYYLLALPLFIIAVAAKSHIALRFVVLSVDNGKLRYTEGMLSRSSRTLELSKIQDVRVDQTLTQRMLGLGDLTLETAGETGRLSMRGIDEPQRVADRILELAHKG
jgi:uncharacterized membrane protein YdbT with pleckstrin-like domain